MGTKLPKSTILPILALKLSSSQQSLVLHGKFWRFPSLEIVSWSIIDPIWLLSTPVQKASSLPKISLKLILSQAKWMMIAQLSGLLWKMAHKKCSSMTPKTLKLFSHKILCLTLTLLMESTRLDPSKEFMFQTLNWEQLFWRPLP